LVFERHPIHILGPELVSFIYVKLFATLQKIVNSEVIIEDAFNVKEVIQKLIKRYPLLEGELLDEKFALRDDYIFLVNGRNIYFLDMENTLLQNNDKIRIFPPIGGG
jgi:molybdopterin synthase sulfur carrier subunit